MNTYAYIVRTQEGLKTAQTEMEEIAQVLSENYLEDRAYLELTNLCLTSLEILKAALKRPSSVGAHYIVDEKGEKL
jgi:aspartate oxidase